MTNVLLQTKVEQLQGCFCTRWTDRETKAHQTIEAGGGYSANKGCALPILYRQQQVFIRI